MSDTTLTVYARRRTLNITVKTLDLSWMAVLLQDEKPLPTKILRSLRPGSSITSD